MHTILKIILAVALLGLIFEGIYLYTHWPEPPEITRKEQPEEIKLPDYFNLDIPFVCQAPLGNWSPPFDNACEEAAILLVHYYLESKSIDPMQAAQDIEDIVEFEKSTYGFYKDTSAEQTAQLIRDYYGYKANVYYDISLQDIKKQLVKGNPVIVPTAGRMLGNPYFTRPGPVLHMLVIKGYTPFEFIVNDVGTSRGADYTYSYSVLENAIHDWEDHNVETGRKAMIVVEKNSLDISH